jgi:hypothetical protein
MHSTIAHPAARKAPDLIRRDFTATVIDLNSRRLVGWAIVDHLRTDLITRTDRHTAGLQPVPYPTPSCSTAFRLPRHQG